MKNEEFGQFRISNDLLDDPKRLGEIYQKEGYLYFRDILDKSAVLRVKEDFIGELQKQGYVKAGVAEPIWTGLESDSIDSDKLYLLSSFEELIELQSLRQCLEKVYNGPVRISPSIGLRYAFPEESKYLTPIHQDAYFIRQTDMFGMLWIPLMDINSEVGGLAVASGSNNDGLFNHASIDDVYSYSFKGRNQSGILPSAIKRPWLTIDYRLGDVLLFHSRTAHRAIANTSDRIRLSLNTLCQHEESPVMWQSEQKQLYLKKHRIDLKRIADEEGASEELFERLHIEAMKRGVEAKRDLVKALLTELRSVT